MPLFETLYGTSRLYTRRLLGDVSSKVMSISTELMPAAAQIGRDSVVLPGSAHFCRWLVMLSPARVLGQIQLAVSVDRRTWNKSTLVLIRCDVASVSIDRGNVRVGDNGRLVDPGRPCKNSGGFEELPSTPGVHVASDDMSQNRMASLAKLSLGNYPPNGT